VLGLVAYGMNITESDLQRFWARVRKTTGCWTWTAGKSRGYGTIYIDGKCRKAHQVSYLLHHGAIEQWLLHRCDNRACVRPDHLFLGDHDANMRDMANKGRSSRLPGERNGNAKLTETKIARLKAALGSASQTELARRFGCSQQTVSNIATGRAWSWVEPATTQTDGW
jgi:hypothetical protein